jgi:S1-C subfamily serine protease
VSEAWVLDLLLVALFACYLVVGYRSGLVRGLASIVGLGAGAVAAYFVSPLVGSTVPDPLWRVFATVAVAIVLVVLGQSIGASVGGALRSTLSKSPLRIVDRLLGAVVSGVAVALILGLLAIGVTSIGVPVLSQTMARSTVLSALTSQMPEPVEALFARLRALAITGGLPLITDALGGVGSPPELPFVETSTPELTLAARSVVRITGNAFECGQNQSGSGFVVAKNRIVTNAHVVAGVAAPVVEAPGGETVTGRVVYFDPLVDLAVIAVDDLDTAALPLSTRLEPGATAVVDGYPFGGPFTTEPAEVLGVQTLEVDDIYSAGTALREVYTLAADVNEGNSGGPLVATDGSVAGVIFAKSADVDNVGYAVTTTELAPVAQAAAGLDSPVASGVCVSG